MISYLTTIEYRKGTKLKLRRCSEKLTFTIMTAMIPTTMITRKNMMHRSVAICSAQGAMLNHVIRA